MTASIQTNIAGARDSGPLLRADALEYHLLKPRDSAHPRAAAAYELWRNGWLATFREVNGFTRIHSDEFSRQDEIGVLCSGARCISVTGLRFVDRAQPLGREDSYFKVWPSEAIEAIGDQLLGISSNTLIHPDFRGTHITLGDSEACEPMTLSFLTIALAFQRFAESPAKKVIGISRNDRSMNRLAAALGGRKLGQIPLHGTEGDLMLLDPTMRYQPPIIDFLWTRRNGS